MLTGPYGATFNKKMAVDVYKANGGSIKSTVEATFEEEGYSTVHKLTAHLHE